MAANLQIVPAACKNVEAQYVEMKVPLYSYGCERKVKKALSHLKGIYSVNVDFGQQKVTVWGICNKYNVLATIKNKRKEAQFWNSEDNIHLEAEGKEETHHSSSPPHPYHRNLHLRLHPLNSALTRVKSISFKAFKNAFNRSYSF
ncbi:hypothetical protein Ancab_010102 [Ancistrocladus abbreviatus]